MYPTIKQLQYLIALKQEGSFSKAAEICNVTQSTLSAGIKELETILGHILVDRSQRQVFLTPLGEDVLGFAGKIQQDLDHLLAHIKTREEPLNAPLHLGVIPTIAPYMLPRILPALHTNFPNLEIRLFEDLTERLLEQLYQRKLDLVLMAFPFASDGIDMHPLFEEPFVIAAPSADTLPQAPVSFDYLDNKSILLLEDGHCLRDHALQACKLQKTPQKKTFSATSLPTLIQMVNHGYGLTLLPEMAAATGSLPDNIRILHFRDPAPTRQIGLAWRKGDGRSRDYKLLGDFIGKLQNA